MLKKLAICILLIGGLSAMADAKGSKKVEVSKYGKVLAPARLEGSNVQTSDAPSLKVEMVPIKDSKDFLIRFSGVEHDDDGKVLRYTREGGPSVWYYTRNGKNRLREEKTNYSDVTVFEFYAGNNTYKLVVDAAETKNLKTDDLVKNFKE